ncbi:unnamed protein product, partial [Nesidiocoris tenuis]
MVALRQVCPWAELQLARLGQGKPKRPKTWGNLLENTWWFSIAPIKWTSEDWGVSSKVWPNQDRGDALTNLTASSSQCFRWLLNKSASFSWQGKKKRLISSS